MNKDIIKRYSNGDVTVIWQPSLCMHSTICFEGLPKVFDPRVEGAVAAPSGPLTVLALLP